jgi:hypothetical protein
VSAIKVPIMQIGRENLSIVIAIQDEGYRIQEAARC